MSVEKEILEQQLVRGIFENAAFDGTEGIARLAIDRGYDALTTRQKNVINPYLTQPCSGVTNPGGHHNECTNVLEGRELLAAYHQSFDTDSLLCEACRGEEGYYENQWAKISQE
ncbi:hypothetical protein [Cobetia sp. UCD-24C]|uniref:hypothetical protein n=1 Tax=Cobetia sp. UCD-24C TaxID=1716176 RepID=UPI0009EA674F|nr:hypothetical protein [Cobetia sp. UCD-24C]